MLINMNSDIHLVVIRAFGVTISFDLRLFIEFILSVELY